MNPRKLLHIRIGLKAFECTTSLSIRQLTDGVIIWPWNALLYQISHSFEFPQSHKSLILLIVVDGTVWMSYTEVVTRGQVKAPYKHMKYNFNIICHFFPISLKINKFVQYSWWPYQYVCHFYGRSHQSCVPTQENPVSTTNGCQMNKLRRANKCTVKTMSSTHRPILSDIIHSAASSHSPG